MTGAPLDIVAIDILSGLPTTPDGLKYILVVTDYFTKWATAFALPDAEASTCMRAMDDGFFSIFGLPCQLHSYQRKNFESKLFPEMCELTGIAKMQTTPFHPQCDGQMEQMNRTLQMLRCTAHENPASWPQRLPTVMSAYRMTVHEVMGLTPNMAMFGREVILPTLLVAQLPKEPVTSAVPFVVDLQDAIRNVHDWVQTATKKAARIQRKYYDEKSRQTTFWEGHLVWLFWQQPPIRQKFKKLRKVWTGPWKIEEFCSPLVVKTRHVTKRTRQTVHIDRLIPCLTPQAVDEPEDSLVDLFGDGNTLQMSSHLFSRTLH